MAKPHKFAWNGVDIETSLSIEQLGNMAQRAALESTGDMLLGKHRIVVVKSTDRAIEFRINDYLISFKKMLVFSLSLVERGGRSYVSTLIDWYLTSQTTVGGFIPVSTKSMVAHGTYMQFVRNLAAQVAAADPAARITMREGVQQPDASAVTPGASATSAETAPLLPPPPQPQPASTLPPPPPPPSAGAAPAATLPPPPPPLGGVVPLPPPPPPGAGPALPPPPPPPVPSAVPAQPATPAAAPSAGLVTGVPGRAAPPAGVPPVPPLPAPAMHSESEGMFDDEDLDATRTSQALVNRPWKLVLPDGAPAVKLGEAIVVGRNPSVPSHMPATTKTVPLIDRFKSVSKSHAGIEVRAGMPWITDFNSTNGTTITNSVGEATVCPPGVAVPAAEGWTVSFGEYMTTFAFDD